MFFLCNSVAVVTSTAHPLPVTKLLLFSSTLSDIFSISMKGVFSLLSWINAFFAVMWVYYRPYWRSVENLQLKLLTFLNHNYFLVTLRHALFKKTDLMHTAVNSSMLCLKHFLIKIKFLFTFYGCFYSDWLH